MELTPTGFLSGECGRNNVVEDTKNDETIPQKLAVVDPKRVLAGGAAVLVVLILVIYLIVRHRDKKRKKKQLSERKEEAESDEK